MTDKPLEIMDAGLNCLIENLGAVIAERFIAIIKKENFDYTVWQRDYFDRMKPGQQGRPNGPTSRVKLKI